MEKMLNKLLLRQIKKHFTSSENIPAELNGFIQDINRTYENFAEDTQLLQNSIEISSQELRDAYLRLKLDAESQKETIRKIKEAIIALDPSVETSPKVGVLSAPTNSNYLFDALIKLIADRNLAEEKVVQSSKKWEAIISASPDGIGMISLDGKLIYASDKLAIMYGYARDEKDTFIGRTIFDFIDPTCHEQLKGNLQKLLSGKMNLKITEYTAIRKDNSRFYIDVNSTVIADPEGNTSTILFVERDITESKLAEEQLYNERELFRTIIDLIPDAVYVKDVDGRKILANPKEVKLSGKSTEEELIGKTDANLYPDNEASRGVQEDRYVIESGKSLIGIEGKLIDNDGNLHWLLVSKVPLHDHHGNITGLVGVTHDVTRLKQAENETKQISVRLELATRAGGVGVWDLDIVNNNLLWDDQMFALYGFEKNSISCGYETWLAAIHPDDVLQSDTRIRMAIDGEKEYDTEFRVVWPDGSVHTIRALATVYRDASGTPLRMIGTNWDISEQKRTEETLIIARQEADSANKAKSEFLANMSHEIRTPLNGVIGFTDLLQKTPLNKIQRQYAENVNASGYALLGIINDILDFSKIEAGKMELDLIKTDVIELAENASDIIKYHASQKGLELLLNIQHDIPRFAVVDPTRLKQILVNLLGNAVKFTESGEVELKVGFTKVDTYTGEFNFSVRDTGIGISKEQQIQLFRAFSQADNSTTRKFGGTGLGLTISNMLAEKMNSRIEIISEPGKGSDFFFTINTTYEEGEKLNADDLSKIKRILVIDDNDNNRTILEHTFLNWGIEFTGTDNGHSALELLGKSEPFDLIIVDYHMPVMNGLETIKQIREQYNLSPKIQPVILLHSSSDDIEIYEECKKLGVLFNLTKPVKSGELMNYLRNIRNDRVYPLPENPNYLIDEPFNLNNGAAPVIMVVEDVVINMILVTTLIRQMIPDVTILKAKNGKEAYDLALSRKPDLIIMDIQMPIMSGIEATIAIREFELGGSTRIPIVALTAGAIKGEESRCFEAGMDDFLTKPLSQKALHEVLVKHLSYRLQVPDLLEKPETKKTTEVHFDQKKLLDNLNADLQVLRDLLEFVPVQFSNDLRILAEAIRENDFSAIKIAAHSLKGASLNMCFMQMAHLSAEIEQAINKNPEKINTLLQDLILEWDQVELMIKNIN